MTKRYIVEGPDGKRYIVEGPSDASEGGGVGAGPQAPTLTPPEAAKPFVRAGDKGAFGAGVAQATIKGVLGAKNLFTELSDEDKGVLREIEAEDKADPEGFKRGAGSLTGNVLMTAAPGLKTAGALNKTRAAMAMGRAAPIATGMAVSGGTEAILAPGEGEGHAEQLMSKGKEAAKAAAIGGAFSGAGQLLARPFKATKEALDLMAQKVYPTLSQGAESMFPKAIGGLTSGILPTKRRQNKEVVNAALTQVLPDVAEDQLPTKTGDIARAMVGVADEYGPMFQGKRFTMSSKDKGDIWGAAVRAGGRQPDVKDEILRRLGGAGIGLRSGNTINLGGEGMRKERSYIQDQIDRVSRDTSTKATEVKKGLIAAKDRFDEQVRNRALTPDELAKLGDLDHRFSDSRRILEGTNSVEARKQVTAADLLRGHKNLASGTKFETADSQMQQRLLDPAMEVMSLNPNQNQMRSLLVTLGRIGKIGAGAGSVFLAPGLAPIYGASLAGQTKTGARAMFGDLEFQKKLADMMRKTGGGSNIGAVLNNQEGEY